MAHRRLLDACLRFRDGRSVPTQLQAPLAVLHSYVLVKAQAKLGAQETAARLLKRTAAALSRFEAHAPQILASAAIQCSHAGLHQSAFALAGELMQPQHRDAMKAMTAHKRKLESLVRARWTMPRMMARIAVGMDGHGAASARSIGTCILAACPCE